MASRKKASHKAPTRKVATRKRVGTSRPPRARAARKAARRSDAPPRKTTRKAAGKTAGTAPRPENLSEIRIQVTTIGDLLLTAADRHPDAEALVFPDFRMTYAQLAARALERARSLQALGVRPREHVGLLLPTCPEFVEFFFAIALCGAVAVPINARYKPHELGYVIENGDLVTIVTTAQIAEQVNFVMRLDGALPGLTAQKNALALELPSAPRLRNIVLLGKSAPTAFVPEKQLAALAKKVPLESVHRSRLGVRVRDVGMMLYTSGTTANPKGCLISHEAMVRNSIALGRYRYRLTARDRFWSPLPMFHIARHPADDRELSMSAVPYLTMGYFDAGRALECSSARR